MTPVTYEDDKGNAGTMFFDTKTGLLHALRMKDATHPDSTTLMLWSDYKRVDGELFAMTTTVKAAGHSVVTRTTHLDHSAIDSARFSPPAAVRDLLRRP